jgi:hypothetical protein
MLRVGADGVWDTRPFGAEPAFGPSDPFVELALLPEKVVTGRAIDGLGRPIAGAHVRARGYLIFMQGALAPDAAQDETDASGRFRLSGLRSDLTHAVWVQVRDFGRATAVAARHDVDADLGDVVVHAGRTLRGSIVDATGRPVVGVPVELVQSAPTDRPVVTMVPHGAIPSSDGWSNTVRHEEEVFADANGAFVFRGLPAASYRVLVRTANVSSTVAIAEADVDLEPLVAKDTLRTLQGWVSRAGERVAGARVDVAEPGRLYRSSSVTDEFGRFVVSGVEEGATYFVRVAAPEADAAEVLVTHDGSPLGVEL